MTPAEHTAAEDYRDWWLAQRAAQETLNSIRALSAKYQMQADQERFAWNWYAGRHLKKDAGTEE